MFPALSRALHGRCNGGLARVGISLTTLDTGLARKMEPRAANSPRNNRIIPGKALNARYWRMTLANTNGCAFEVHSLAADIALSARRI